MKRIKVTTRRLELRPLKKSDYQTWYEAYVHRLPKQSKWDFGPMDKKKCTQKIFLKIMKRHQDFAKKDDWYFYGVFEKKSGALVGAIDFDIFVRGSHQFANFGYRIHNRHWGKGFGQEASRAALKIGFKQLKLNRLEAAINLDHKKSIQLAQSIGMKYEGLKKRYWFENNKWVDHLIYVANPEDCGLKPKKPY